MNEQNNILEDEMILPVLALRGVTVFPKMFLHFDAKRPKSVKALDIAMKSKQLLFVVAQKEAGTEDIDISEDVYEVGTIVRVKQVVKLPGNISRVLVEGLSRGQLIDATDDGKHFNGIVEVLQPENPKAMRFVRKPSIGWLMESSLNSSP